MAGDARKEHPHGTPEDMILDGSLEAAFHLTGYDLKTGKIKHPHDRKISVRLTGEEPAHRWTKNALERNGFEVTPAGTLDVRIERLESLAWRLPGDRICRSLEALIAELEKMADHILSTPSPGLSEQVITPSFKTNPPFTTSRARSRLPSRSMYFVFAQAKAT